MRRTEEVEWKVADHEPASGVRWPFVLLCCLPLLVLRVWVFLTRPQLFDFITYWVSGHLFLVGGDPYSRSAMLAAERLQGWPYEQPMMTFCPPWAMSLITVFSLFPFRTAQIGWFIVSLLLNCLSSIGLWSYFGGQKGKAWIAILVSVTFFPMGGAELVGQITPLMLASLTAFLLLVKSERYFVAGVILLGFGFKPHLLYLVLLTLLFWIVKERKWRMLSGALLSYGAASIAAFLLNPNSSNYLHRSFDAAVEVPCGVGGVLRSIFGFQYLWLQFLSCFFGVAWLLYYWAKHKREWDWQVHLPLVLLVSVSSSPYCWYHDFILILPAMIALAVRKGYRNFYTLVAYLVVQVLIVGSFALSEVWASLASALWIAFYCLAKAETNSNGNRVSLGTVVLTRGPESFGRS